jgi:hypothetical protein
VRAGQCDITDSDRCRAPPWTRTNGSRSSGR